MAISEQGLAAARAVARFHIGDQDWADLILAAAEDPSSAWEDLAEAGDEIAKRRVEARTDR